MITTNIKHVLIPFIPIIFIDYTHISPTYCILKRVMGIVSPEDRRSKGDTRTIARGRIQLGRVDVWEETTLAMILSFYLIPTFSVKEGLD